MKEQTNTQIRIPKEFDDEINKVCSDTGMSKNSAMLMLMRFGLKIYSSDISIALCYPQNKD